MKDKDVEPQIEEESADPVGVRHHGSHESVHVEEEKQDFWTKEEEVNGFEEKQENRRDVSDSGTKTSPDPVNPGIEQANGSSFLGNKTLLIVGVVVLTLLGLGGGFWYWQGKKAEQELAQATVEPTPTATPQAAVSEKPDLTEYKVQVLNGSGTPGEAGRAQELLETEGFEGVETGNAKSFAYKLTQIYTQKDTPDEVVEVAKKALVEKYALEEAIKFLDKSSDFDIQITVGSQKVK